MSSSLTVVIITLGFGGLCFKSIIKNSNDSSSEKFLKPPLPWQRLLRALGKETHIRIALLIADVLANFEKPPE